MLFEIIICSLSQQEYRKTFYHVYGTKDDLFTSRELREVTLS